MRDYIATQSNICTALESTIYIPLDNYRDESELKFKKLRDK
jgi:hypothetical protein